MRKSKPIRKESEIEILKAFGNKLKEIRQKRGYSQEEFANVAGFSRSYYTEIETGTRNVSLINLLKILKHLEVNEKESLDLIRLFKNV